MTHLLIRGDARRIPLADQSVQCVVTSPPFFGLRNYDEPNQIGLEPTPAEFVAALIRVFREVWRVLRDDGTAWVNLGDSYANDTKWGGSGSGPTSKNYTSGLGGCVGQKAKRITGFKPKDRMGIPHRVVFGLQDDGWYWRDEIVWSKPNPMPESVTDRTTKAHEFIFLLSKRERYHYDADAIREKSIRAGDIPGGTKYIGNGMRFCSDGKNASSPVAENRNKRSVWSVATVPFFGSHFAAFPPKLIEPCIKAGSAVGGIVFDPFVGAGTTIVVANALGRNGIGTDLNHSYLKIASRRITRPHAPNQRVSVEESLPLFT